MGGASASASPLLLRQWIGLLGTLEQHITAVEEEIDRHMPPFAWAAELLVAIPGIDRTAACALLAEVGVDMSRFASAGHLASWAGLCPGNNSSAGKSRCGKSHRGNRWIKGLMTEIAWAASRTKNSDPSALVPAPGCPSRKEARSWPWPTLRFKSCGTYSHIGKPTRIWAETTSTGEIVRR